MTKEKRDKKQKKTMVYNTLHKKLKIELKPDGELRCSERVTSSFSTSGNSRSTLVVNPVMYYEPS
jgi:hypothetical protein